MKDAKRIALEQFDSYISKALKNVVFSHARGKSRKILRECNFSDLTEKQKNSLFEYDEYFKDERYRIKALEKFEAEIKDKLLFEALIKLKSNSKDIIVLKYWHELSDEKIGELLNIKRSTVNYKKLKALHTLKQIIEEMIE